MILGGLVFPIFQTYTLKNLLLETQLSVYLGLYLLLGEFLSYIVVLLSVALFNTCCS